MKTVVKFTVGICMSLYMIACSKDDDKTQIAHDEDRMMMIMHEMDEKMDTMKMTQDVDHDFSMMMILHHQTAINMAEEMLRSGKDTALKGMAQKMIEMQTEEIRELQAFINGHEKVPHNVNEDAHMQMMESMEKMARQADLELFTGDTDNDFATLMIPHHQGAFDMAEVETHFGHDPVPMRLAEKIKKDQQMEMEELQRWLLDHRK